MRRNTCEICGNLLVEPTGSPVAPLFLFGPGPGYREVQEGKPWVGPAGEVLRDELFRADIGTHHCRLSNLWLHTEKKDEDEFNWHVERLLSDMDGAKAVLMMGAMPCILFYEQSVVDIGGIKMRPPKTFPDSVEFVVAIKNPASALKGTVGEVRHGIERFSRLTKEWRL